MLRVNPFAALRPDPENARQVASVPYDVVSTEEARKLAEGNPLSFLHVVRPEIDLPPETDPHADEVYAQARKAFDRLQAEGALVREDSPKIYLYRQQAKLNGNAVSQIGVVACCHIDDYRNGLIKKHEKTRKDKEDDRTKHVVTLKANAGPVFLLYQGDEALTKMIDDDAMGPPIHDFLAEDMVRHTVWAVEEPDAYIAAFAHVQAAYVADGHHRSASASRAGAELRTANPKHTGKEEYNWFQCVLFASDQLNILPYHRVVKDLNGLSAAEFLEKMGEVGEVVPTDTPQPAHSGAFGMFVDGAWYMVTLPRDGIDRSDPVESLDYVLLYERVLSPILGIGEIRTDTRIDFVGGIRGTAELERRVKSGRFAVAFAMHETTIDQLMSVADAGRIMPPKSTWFEPKLRSGLLVHTLD